ncbi:hypothetical protein BJQ90_03645 [Arthrobacter sp. SO3]|nr:hypothetical protein [Arthrobacter sp. SO3]
MGANDPHPVLWSAFYHGLDLGGVAENIGGQNIEFIPKLQLEVEQRAPKSNVCTEIVGVFHRPCDYKELVEWDDCKIRVIYSAVRKTLVVPNSATIGMEGDG